MDYTGSCLCRKVKYKVSGDFDSFYLCHCGYCRKGSGSAHASNLFSGDANLEWLSGKELVRTFKVPNSSHQRSFCSNCGAALPNMQMDGTLLVVPAGSLDTDLDKDPDGHIFISKKANWDMELHKVKKFDEFPE